MHVILNLLKNELLLPRLFFMAMKKYRSLKKTTKYIHYAKLAKGGGIVPFRWDRIATEYTDDYYANTGIPLKEKEWYYVRGITTYKTQWYGLTQSNYNDYISDFDFYHKTNYKNKKHDVWFENKLNTFFLLAPFKDYMPKHFFYIEFGKTYPLEFSKKYDNNVNDIIQIIRKQPVAAKACYGGHGKGFYKIEYGNNEKFFVNGISFDEASLRSLIESFENYIVTEFVTPHSKIRELCGEDAFAVIRTVSIYDKTTGGQITAMVIRLGSKTAGYLADYDGTIYCGINLHDGSFFEPVYRTGDMEGILIRHNLQVHPDTHKKLDGFVLPHFEQLKILVKNISEFLPMTPYLVMDIVPTESGFKILEINSHGQVRNVEPWFPFRKNEYNLKVFNTVER